ncbi:unnamed protein product [Leuciscus chuanchicus]
MAVLGLPQQNTSRLTHSVPPWDLSNPTRTVFTATLDTTGAVRWAIITIFWATIGAAFWANITTAANLDTAGAALLAATAVCRDIAAAHLAIIAARLDTTAAHLATTAAHLATTTTYLAIIAACLATTAAYLATIAANLDTIIAAHLVTTGAAHLVITEANLPPTAANILHSLPVCRRGTLGRCRSSRGLWNMLVLIRGTGVSARCLNSRFHGRAWAWAWAWAWARLAWIGASGGCRGGGSAC